VLHKGSDERDRRLAADNRKRAASTRGVIFAADFHEKGTIRKNAGSHRPTDQLVSVARAFGGRRTHPCLLVGDPGRAELEDAGLDLLSNSRRSPGSLRRFSMLRLLASLALAVAFAAQPAAQAAQKAAAPRNDAKPAVATINLNTATAAELEKLPGIGQKVAARIVEYRQKNGPFKKVEELMNVQGIGEKSFLQFRSQLTVGQ
jgi:competence protein ComEA